MERKIQEKVSLSQYKGDDGCYLVCTLAKRPSALLKQKIKQMDEIKKLSCEGSKGRRKPNLICQFKNRNRNHHSAVKSPSQNGLEMCL